MISKRKLKEIAKIYASNVLMQNPCVETKLLNQEETDYVETEIIKIGCRIQYKTQNASLDEIIKIVINRSTQ